MMIAISNLRIDWWLPPLLSLFGVLFYFALKYGKDTTLELLVKIDSKIDVIIDKL